MSVEFEEDNLKQGVYQSRQILGSLATPKAVRWLLDKGIVKSEKSAGRLLLAFACLCFLLAIAIALYSAGIISPVSSWGKAEQPVSYLVWKNLPPDIQAKTPHTP